MKSIDVENSIEKYGDVNAEVGFKIKASRASFQILSSGLYSNKIRAIIRELCCNAHDAHKSAGTQDTPFEISLPSTFSPVLVIKDFGTGLSHEDVMTIYTTYFESTKNNSNDFIGQLGLGSKSPFSYTNQFLVESRHEGVSRSYSMFINEHGLPSVSQIGEAETEEPNGMTITIAVKQNDFYKFREESEYVLKYFNPYPNVIGAHSRQKFEYRVIKDNFAIRNEVSYHSSIPNVIQGFISYPLDIEQLSSYVSETVYLSEEARCILTAPIDLFMKIGDVQVAPSREHLSYDNRTIENIILALNQVGSEITKHFHEMIDSCETIFDARILVNSFMDHRNVFRKIFDKMHNGTKIEFTYKGNVITGSVFLSDIDLPENVFFYLYTKSKNYYHNRVTYAKLDSANLEHYKKIKVCGHTYAHIQVTNDTRLIVCDEYVPINDMKEYINSNLTITQDTMLVEVRPKKKEDITQTTKDLIDLFGIPEDDERIIYTSKLYADGEIEKKVKAPRAKKDKILRNKKERGVSVFDMRGIRTSYSHEMVDFLTEKCFYIPVFRGEYKKDFSDDSKSSGNLGIGPLSDCVEFINEFCGGFGKDVEKIRIIDVTFKDEKLVKENKNLINFVDFFIECVEKNYEKLCDALRIKNKNEAIRYTYIEFINECILLGNYKPTVCQDTLSKFIDIENGYVDIRETNTYNRTCYFITRCSDEIVSSDIKKKISESNETSLDYTVNSEIEEALKSRYPLFSLYSNRFWWNYSTNSSDKNFIESCVEYMNFIDGKLSSKTSEEPEVKQKFAILP